MTYPDSSGDETVDASSFRPVLRKRSRGLLILVLALSVALLGSCGGTPSRHAANAPSGDSSLTAMLYEQYREWKGTKYRYGGLSKRGVDCSGFVYLTFRDLLGIELPRTTQYQSRAGVGVTPAGLRAGDLVFFQTGATKHHVGIYLDNRQFLHASASKGVMLSSLEDSYWATRYWRARRVVL